MHPRFLIVAMALGAFLCCQRASGQGFNKRYDAFGGGYWQESWDIEPSGPDYIVFSASYEPDTVNPDSILYDLRIILQWIDSQGNLLEEKRHKVPFHSLYLGWADCCDSVVGGGYVSAGGVESIDLSTAIHLMRYDTNGDTLWTRDIGDSTHFWISSQVKQTADGGFLITGYTEAPFYTDGFALKTDMLGNEQWRHTYGGGFVDDYSDIALLPDGYLLAGETYPTFENRDFLVTRITETGSELWTVRFGSPYWEPVASIARLSDGRFVLFGAWGADANEFMTPYIAVLDPGDGHVTWSHQYGPPNFSKTLFAGKECPDGDIIACGVSYDGGQQQGLLLRSTSTGDSLWMRNYAFHDSVIDQGSGRFWDVLPTADGGCIAVGAAYQPFNAPYPPGYSQDAWVVKVDSMGCVVPGCNGVAGITAQVTNLGDVLKLYPNPLSPSKGNGQMHVGIHLPGNFATTGPLTLSATTMEGKLVLQRQVPTSAAGEVVLDVSSLSSGMYAVHLSDATRWLAGKKFVVQ
ncbi:MAG: hypothetical protein JST45_11415 [Bacteroidetes bacterium]|nr:hypothetical protein [Bacteroidota bacterium]